MFKTYITNIDGEWFAYAGDTETNQVCSIGRDNPRDNKYASRYFARWTNHGIRYVSSPSPNRAAAYKRASRGGIYAGEV